MPHEGRSIAEGEYDCASFRRSDAIRLCWEHLMIIKFVRFRRRQQIHEPIDKYSHLVTEMPVRRIDDVEWDACTMPFRQNIHQFATRNCLACRKARCLANA